MLDIKWIRDNPQALVEALKKRPSYAADAESTVQTLIELDEKRRAAIAKVQVSQERRNAASKDIGKAMGAKDMATAERLKAEVADLKASMPTDEAKERELSKALDDALAVLPNVPLDGVPIGKDEHDNVEARKVGVIKTRPNWVKEHFEIGEASGFMDFERAAKLSGARFTVLKGQLARLERALGQFMLDLHTTEHGYTEVQPPLMVNADTMYGTGQLPKFADDLFTTVSRDVVDPTEFDIEFREPGYPTFLFKGPRAIDLSARFEGQVLLASAAGVPINQQIRPVLETQRFLIPTSEVPLTNLVREEITAHEKLPLRFTALTPCFRSEAGSAGRDTRGMLRQHQFYKVELVSITDQDNSLAEHERMTECAEAVLKKLELPFRTVTLCTGDMGFGARKTYDIEVWLPGQNAYREISSCSVCGDFQARRMNARYKDKDGKGNLFVHTLNGSGTAVGRALIAVMENYQNEDGSVTVPDVLLPYMGGLKKIEGKAA